MSTARIDSAIRTLVDLIYQQQTPLADPLALLPQWFEALRGLFGFSSAVFVPIDPVGGALSPGHRDDAPRHDSGQAAGRCLALDPWVLLAPALKNPNTVVRLSEVAELTTTARGEGNESLQRVPYFHALAMVPLLHGVPLGMFAVHRLRRQHDFDPHEGALFEWFVSHAATGIEYLTLRQRLEQNESTAFVVLTRDGRIRSLSVEAQRILEAIPENTTLPLPGPAECSRIWRCASQVYAVSTRRVAPAALIGIGDAHSLPCASAVARLADRLAVAPDEQRRELAVTIERLDADTVVRGEVFGLNLTPQQKRVAILLLKRYEPRQIADILALSPHTVRDYVKEIYRRAGVSGAAALIRRLSPISDRGG